MCYLIATKLGQRGCIGVEMSDGKKIASLSQYLSSCKPELQIVTVGNKEAYKEYAPYDICCNELEFINKVFSL